MARRSGNKETVLYDSLKNVAVASEQHLNDDQLLEKIAKVKDVFPARSKHEIILVLQYYEFDETAAINAFTEDGAAKALNDWNYTGNNKSKTNTRSKKKNKKKNKKDSACRENLQSNESLVSKEESTDIQAEVSVSLDQHQEENHIDEERKSTCDAEDLNEVVPESSCPENIVVSSPTEDTIDLDVTHSKATEEHQHNEEGKDEINETQLIQPSKQSDCSQSTSQQRIPLVTSSSSSSTLYSSRFPSRSQGRRGLEKSLKDLSRQTAALQRVHTVLEDELQDSDRRIKQAFQDIQRILEERKLELVQEMEKVRRDSRQLIAQRQELAVELKKRAERASSLAESDQDELRADIKQFVVERKYDDELSRTARFVWDRDKICEELRNIGEVVHVKNSYSQRRYSVSSVASSTNQEPVEQQITNTSSSICNLDKPEETTEGSEANGGTSSQSPIQDRYSAGYPRQESRPRIFSNRGRWSPAYRNAQNNFNGRYLHRGRGGRGRGGWQDNYHHTGPPQYPTNIRDRPPNNHRRTDGSFDNSRGASGYMHRSPRRDWHRQWNNYPSKSGQESNPKDNEVDKERGSGEGHFTKTESKENVSNIVNGFVEH